MNPQATVAAILSAGLTQGEAAEQAKCSQSMISAILNGKRGANISKALGDRLQALHKKVKRAKRGSASA